MPVNARKFGEVIREAREAREIGLREMAQKIGVSAAYLSRVERGVVPPPVEGRIRVIARILERDPDELLALAGRVPSDIAAIIRRAPVEVSALLRSTRGRTREEIARLASSWG